MSTELKFFAQINIIIIVIVTIFHVTKHFFSFIIESISDYLGRKKNERKIIFNLVEINNSLEKIKNEYLDIKEVDESEIILSKVKIIKKFFCIDSSKMIYDLIKSGYLKFHGFKDKKYLNLSFRVYDFMNTLSTVNSIPEEIIIDDIDFSLIIPLPFFKGLISEVDKLHGEIKIILHE